MDYALEATFDLKFDTRAFATDIPTTFLGSPAIEIYEDDSATQIIAAETLTVDFDGVTGLNNLRIVATAANGFEDGKSYAAVVSAGTVDGVTWVGRVLFNFTIGVLANSVWNALLKGSTFNIATSAGRRLRQIEQAFTHASGVIADVTDGHTFTLDAGAVATANYYIGDRLQITEGTGAGQSRLIVAYTSGKVVTLDSNYTINPDTSSLYEVVAADVHVSLNDADLAQGFVATYTNATTITLDDAAVAKTDFYNGAIIVFTHGAGAGQFREIVGYTSGRVLTMSPALITALDATTVYHIQVAASVLDVDAIKAVTDQMVFTKANELDGNMKSINDATVTGDGSATPWGSA